MHNCKIGIVTFPLGESNIIPLYNLISITRCLTNHVYIITGNAGIEVAQKLNDLHFELIYHTSGSNVITRVYNYARTQLIITLRMIKLSRNVDLWIFPIGGEALLPCMVLAKILRKPVIMSLTSSVESMAKHQQNPLALIIAFFSKINYLLADKIILYSPSLITDWNLEKYYRKIRIAHEHFLDFNNFTVTTSLSARPRLIGYIGRLSREKGVQHFVQALPTILNDQKDLRIFIGGDGLLKETIEASLQEEELVTRVDLPGWISHDDLPKYLNQLHLLVIPSYIEGLPNIMLEAMACGTPVLATPVGMIPDVIIDGKTGFIMGNNSPECVAENVLRALRHEDLEEIADNGRRLVQGSYSFRKTVEDWKKILQDT